MNIHQNRIFENGMGFPSEIGQESFFENFVTPETNFHAAGATEREAAAP